MKLFSESNYKLNKGDGRYAAVGLALAPARHSGHDVCPESGVCASVCTLWFSGRTVFPLVRDAMIRRTRFLMEDRAAFIEQLHAEIEQESKRVRALGLWPLFRLNVASDLDWSGVARAFPRERFYDYTKVWSRCQQVLSGRWPANYQLTYSFSERAVPGNCARYLDCGRNVSVAFSVEYVPQWDKLGKLPRTYVIAHRRYRVVDGDRHDFRTRSHDGSGVVVGLRFKGSRQRPQYQTAIERGFVVDP